MWEPRSLNGARVALFAGVVEVQRGDSGCGGEWLLFGTPLVLVNGWPLALGVRVLRDRDEISAASKRLFFSTESLVRVESFDGAPIPCARCQQQIADGAASVRCPECGAVCHEGELPCWSYAPTCPRCPQPTVLDAGFNWTPEVLGA